MVVMAVMIVMVVLLRFVCFPCRQSKLGSQSVLPILNRQTLLEQTEFPCLVKRLCPYSSKVPPSDNHCLLDQTRDTHLCPSLVRLRLGVLSPATPYFHAGSELLESFQVDCLKCVFSGEVESSAKQIEILAS